MNEPSQMKAIVEKIVMQMQRPFINLQMNSIFIMNWICEQNNEMEMMKKNIFKYKLISSDMDTMVIDEESEANIKKIQKKSPRTTFNRTQQKPKKQGWMS